MMQIFQFFPRHIQDKKRFFLLAYGLILISLICGIFASLYIYPQVVSISNITGIQDTIGELAEKNNRLTNEIQNLRQQKDILTKAILPESIRNEIELLEREAGTRSIEGSGVTFVIDDNTNTSLFAQEGITCHGSTLRDVLNILKLPLLEVTAISINDIRIHPFSRIHCFADGVSIDTNPAYPPYRFKILTESSEKTQEILQDKNILDTLWNLEAENKARIIVSKSGLLSLPPTLTSSDISLPRSIWRK